MTVENSTTNYNFPLPNVENMLVTDVDRIANSITSIDEQIKSVSDVVSTNAVNIEDLKEKLDNFEIDSIATITNEQIDDILNSLD